MGDEAARLAALHGFGVLDVPVDDELTAVVRAAAAIAGVPTATLNLIDENRQCQLTTTGFDGGDSAREDSMCALVFTSGRTTHVPDARLDARFAGNPWVTGVLAKVRFYVSVPLVTSDGHALGSLCVFGTEPKVLSDGQVAALEDLAHVTLALFERRRQARRNAELAVEAQQSRELAETFAGDLEARRELIEAVHASIDVAIVACDQNGRLTLLNPAARRWLRVDADLDLDLDLRAKQYDLYAADGVTPLEPEQVPLQRALSGRTVRDVEIVLAPADRPAMRVTCTGKALHRADGTLLGAVIAMTDVTADRAHRQQLADREALMTAVLDSAPDAFVTADSAGDVTVWNPAATALFGWSAGEAIGRPLADLIIPESLRAAHRAGLARRVATGEARLSGAVQVPGRRRDGTEMSLELSLGSFTWKEEPRFHAFLRDVTEREAAREQLTRANTDLAAANEELDRFTAMVAHDLKTPLTAIAGYTEVLHDAWEQVRPAGDTGCVRAGDTALTAITRAAARMRVMIDDLLEHARASQEPLSRQPVDLGVLVDDLAAEITAISPRDVRLTHTRLPVVPAHPTLLRQVLANLIGNAVKYVASDVTPRVHIGAAADDAVVTISVTDNGIGIDESAREKVFALFHREPTQEHYQGSGVGLATCRRIIERHGGRIRVEPGDGPGTTVTFTLPATA